MHRYGLKQLTVELFGEATGLLWTDKPAKERRDEPRAALLAVVDVVAMTDHGPHVSRCRVRDLSRQGMSLLMRWELRREQMLLMRLPSRMRGQSLELTCAVAHCEPAEEMFCVGVQVRRAVRVDEIRRAARAAAAEIHPLTDVERSESERIASAILS